MSLDITDPIQRLWPSCPVDMLQGIINTSDDVFQKFGMAGNRLRILHFMTQISAETGGGLPSETVENLNYSAGGLLKTFPTHFTRAQAEACAHHPQEIANRAYGGRMGNTGPNDGWLYRGQGLLQTTGKGLYGQLGTVVDIDLLANPGALIAPNTALLCAAGDFVGVCRCLPYADQDNLLEVSAMVNTGHPVQDWRSVNGAAARQSWYKLWSQALQ